MKDHFRILQGSGIALALYTSLIVAIAEGSVFPYVFTLPIAAWVIVVSRYRPNWLLKALPANVLGLLAFALAGTELLTGSIEARLLSGAHLMLYLKWIILAQQKRTVQFWWLYALCVLMTGIGGVLLADALYGVLLIGFLMLAVWNLALFSLHRARARVAATGEAPAGARTSEAGRATGLRLPSVAAGGIQSDADDRWTSARFISGTLAMVLVSLAIGFAFYLLIPRMWVGKVAWGSEGSIDRGRSLVGFGESVELGSFGTMLESTELVMEVRAVDADGNPIDVEAYARRLGYDVPLFRGHALDVYDDGSWSRFDSGIRRGRLARRPAGRFVRQYVRLRPTGSTVLFAMRADPLRRLPGARIDGEYRRERRPVVDGNMVLRHVGRSGVRRTLEYTVYTRETSRTPRAGIQPPSPACRSVSPRLRAQLAGFLARHVNFERTDTARRRADRIVDLLRDSGDYTYSLSIPPQQHPELDPVVEFLQYRKSGHCEFYATALSLLLRVAGIPSRLVGGFKGGRTNAVSGYFEVQQLHAHAWAEAFIDGEWVTLDATPAARDQSVQAVAGGFSWENVTRFVKDLWTNHVIELTYSTQDRNVYGPLRRSAGDAWNSLSHERRKSATGWQALRAFLSHPSRWFSWQGGLLSFVIMLLAASLVWAAKRLLRLLSGMKRLADEQARRHVSVAFYERFRRLCETLGLIRAPSQTQREFAAAVSRALGERLPAAAGIPAEVTAAFYDVRFGAVTLTADQLHRLDAWLTQLETAVNGGGNG